MHPPSRFTTLLLAALLMSVSAPGISKAAQADDDAMSLAALAPLSLASLSLATAPRGRSALDTFAEIFAATHFGTEDPLVVLDEDLASTEAAVGDAVISGVVDARGEATMVTAFAAGSYRDVNFDDALAVAATGADGVFMLRGLTPGVYDLVVVAHGYVTEVYASDVAVGAGENVTLNDPLKPVATA
ncbi:MAG: carboxypeptidase regulatory-like domain-containing protein [Deltaproteobacteria bacterium]|nr:carboxypeptidase regulatory-like domain-containing protein [Deltaproteobacteria bacterium]MCB9490016.1 carboxypeptidase regulatory-like domain-containing protein [Deltaproteobacteria bacterium]